MKGEVLDAINVLIPMAKRQYTLTKMKLKECNRLMEKLKNPEMHYRLARHIEEYTADIAAYEEAIAVLRRNA